MLPGILCSSCVTSVHKVGRNEVINGRMIFVVSPKLNSFANRKFKAAEKNNTDERLKTTVSILLNSFKQSTTRLTVKRTTVFSQSFGLKKKNSVVNRSIGVDNTEAEKHENQHKSLIFIALNAAMSLLQFKNSWSPGVFFRVPNLNISFLCQFKLQLNKCCNRSGF